MDIHEVALRILQGLLSGPTENLSPKVFDKLIEHSYQIAEKFIIYGQEFEEKSFEGLEE